MPSSITTVATILPGTSVGVMSPYPTVVTVCTDHHMPIQTLEKWSGSNTLIATPPAITTKVVAVTMTRTAERTDTGPPRNRDI